MKKAILTSIFSLFILAGTGMLLNASETEVPKAKTSCTSSETAQTAATASDCPPTSTAAKSTEAACGSEDKTKTVQAIQTSGEEATECCPSKEASAQQTSSATKAACDSGSAVKSTQTAGSPAGECTKLPSGLRAQSEVK